jgi:hypothetical protein
MQHQMPAKQISHGRQILHDYAEQYWNHQGFNLGASIHGSQALLFRALGRPIHNVVR